MHEPLDILMVVPMISMLALLWQQKRPIVPLTTHVRCIFIEQPYMYSHSNVCILSDVASSNELLSWQMKSYASLSIKWYQFT